MSNPYDRVDTYGSSPRSLSLDFWSTERGKRFLVVATHDITVALPVYNGERYVAEAIQSVLDQTTSPGEFLVFDNCSTDRTVEVARRLLPVEAIRTSPSNAGAISNFNRAVRESAGEYFLWLAADDRLLPRHLEYCLQALVDLPKAQACLPGIRYIDLAGRPVREQSDDALAAADPRHRLRSYVRRRRWTESYCLYRRKALLASPMFTRDYGTDVLLTWWFLLRGPLAVVPDPLLEYREYPSKTVTEMAKSLDPDAPLQHWRKIRLWRRMWRETRGSDIDSRTRRIARQELVLCLPHKDWMTHMSEDALLYLTSVARKPGPGARMLSSMLTTAQGAVRRRRLRHDRGRR